MEKDITLDRAEQAAMKLLIELCESDQTNNPEMVAAIAGLYRTILGDGL